jgi:hypothetical protein
VTSAIPEFGTATAGTEYRPRHGGYAVIWGAAGNVAAVATSFGLALPGGGEEDGETPEMRPSARSRRSAGCASP